MFAKERFADFLKKKQNQQNEILCKWFRLYDMVLTFGSPLQWVDNTCLVVLRIITFFQHEIYGQLPPAFFFTFMSHQSTSIIFLMKNCHQVGAGIQKFKTYPVSPSSVIFWRQAVTFCISFLLSSSSSFHCRLTYSYFLYTATIEAIGSLKSLSTQFHMPLICLSEYFTFFFSQTSSTIFLITDVFNGDLQLSQEI